MPIKQSLQGLNALLVYDAREVGGFIGRIIGLVGATVRFATNGHAALQLVAAEKPDFILTEIRLYGMDGFAMIAALKNDPATQAIPIIVVTHVYSAEWRLKALELGCLDYIVPTSFIGGDKGPFWEHLISLLRGVPALAGRIAVDGRESDPAD